MTKKFVNKSFGVVEDIDDVLVRMVDQHNEELKKQRLKAFYDLFSLGASLEEIAVLQRTSIKGRKWTVVIHTMPLKVSIDCDAEKFLLQAVKGEDWTIYTTKELQGRIEAPSLLYPSGGGDD